MAKVNTLIHNEIYVSATNPNMKFHLMIRSFDGTDRKSAAVKDDQFINGSIDGVDVLSDCLTEEDYWQSEHVILRPKEERVFNGHDYRMIESLANSCDIASCADFDQMIVDNKGHERRFRQYYTKEPDSKTVNVKSYVEDILVSETYFNFVYTPTDYSDEDPKETCLTSYSANYEELQNEIITMIQEGRIVEKMPAPDIIEDTYVTHDVKFYYKGSWKVDIRPNGEDDYVNEITFVLQYGTTRKTEIQFSSTSSLFSDENYGDAATVLAGVAVAETEKLKAYLDKIATANDIEIPPDITGFYRAGQVVYYYWLHYDAQTQNNDGDIKTTVICTLRWGTDDTANVFFSDKKSYDISNYTTAPVELTELGKQQIDELFNHLDNLTGVKLVTVTGPEENRVSQEVGAHPRDVTGNALVVVAHEFEQGADIRTQAMVHFDGDNIVDETGSPWTVGGGTPITTAQGAAMGKGMLISDGRYISSKAIQMGAESFTVDFFAFVNEGCPSDACICDINHPNCDIKIKLLKQFNSKTQETETTIGFYVNGELKAQSKIDIIVLETVCHYAVVYQQAKHALFFFVEGTMIGNMEQEISKAPTKVWFNRDVSANKSTFLGTIDEIRISTDLARWTTDVNFKEYATGVIKDEKNIEWHMYARDPKNAKVETTTPAEFVKAEEGQDKFGTGIVFDGHKYAYMATPLKLGGRDFSIDFWVNITKPGSSNGGIFEIEIGQREYILGFHDYSSEACIHDSKETQKKMKAIKSTFRHVAIVYVQETGKITFYSDGSVVGKIGSFDPKGKLKTESSFRLKIGRYQGTGTTGYLIGIIDEFRIVSGCIPSMFLDDNGNLLSKFTLPTEPYPSDDDFTVALLRSSAFNEVPDDNDEEDFEVDNPNHIFNPPTTSYKISTQVTGDPTQLTNYYIPLVEHFDDDKFTVIDQAPIQKTPYPVYDGETEYEPEWMYYDPQQLKLEGDLKSKKAGDHYVTFTPWNDCLWQGGGNKPKTVIWKIVKDNIKFLPEQEEPLYYNGEEQQNNVINLDSKYMTFTGDLTAKDANTLAKPFYIIVATPKDNYEWPTGMSGPYKVLWQILPKQVERPVLKTTSSLDFVYDGTEKTPEFKYDSRYITATGTLAATLPNSKHIDGSLLTEEYKITFSLKDKNNYCWPSDHSHEDGEGSDTDGGTDDIIVTWKIRRKPVAMFSVTDTTLVYKPEEQGPTLAPSVWDPNEVTVQGHRAQNAGSYVITFTLVDITKYEWDNGATGEATKDWEIVKAQGTLDVDKTTAALIAPPTPPTVDITITTTSTGSVTCIVPDNFKSYIETDISASSSVGQDNSISCSYTLHITGLKSTEADEPVVLTVTLNDDINYKGTSVDITVTVEMGLEAFTWAEIADMTAAGTLLNFASIGDAKTVKLKTKLPIIDTEGESVAEYDDSDDYAVKMILIGVDHNPDVEGSKRAHFMLGRMGSKRDIVFPCNMPVFDTSSNTYGWRNSNLNLQLNTPYSGVYYADIFPSNFLEVITPCLKWTDNMGGGVNNSHFVTPTLDYVIIPSEYEVFGTSSYANSEESKHQERYAYFAEGGAVKRERTDNTSSNGWALRSVNSSSSTQVAAVGSNGALTSVPINSILDITPIFTVSRKIECVLDIPAIDQCVETLMHFDDPDDPFKDECNTSFRILDITTGAAKDAVVSTQNAKFGGALQFDGSTYAVQKIPIILGGKDFTIDFWMYYDAASSSTAGKQAYGFILNGPGITFYCHRTAGQRKFTIGMGGKTTKYTRTDFDPLNKWVHVAIVYHYSRKTVFFYMNGALTTHSDGDTTAVFNNISMPKGKYTLVLGGNKSVGTAMIGAIDELRIQNGIARWTPPEWAFTRRATTADADRQVFTPPAFAGETSENDILHDQNTGGYIIKLNNVVKQKELLITGPVTTINDLHIHHRLNILNTNPSVATAVHDDSTSMLTIKGVSPGRTTVTLFTYDSDITYGAVRTFDVICETNVGLTKLQDCEPADIKSIVREGMASKAWSAGETTKDIQLSGTVNGQNIDQTVKAKLIAIDHNKYKETADQHNAYFMISGLNISLPMNDTSTNEGGWASSKMRQDFCNEILSCFPLSWRNIVSYCSKATDNKGTGTDKQESDITVTQDEVFLLSEYEIFGTVVWGNVLETYGQQQYGYFNDVSNRPVTWTRSCVRSNDNNMFVIRTNMTDSGRAGLSAGSSHPVVFCFCVSDYAGPALLDMDMSSFNTVKEIEFDGANHNAIDEGVILTEAGTKLNSKYHVWTGEYTGRDVKTYTVSIKPAPGYHWKDDTESTKIVQWKIKAASSEDISANKTEVRLYHKNPEETLTVVRNNVSPLQTTVADPSLLSVSASGNQITLVPTGLGETTVTIVSPAAGNYGRGEATVAVKASNVPALASLTPEQVQTVVLTGKAGLAWDVGESTSDIRLNGVVNGQVINNTVKACVLGFDHNSDIEGAKKLHLCLGRDITGKDTGLFEFATTASTGYTDSSLRTVACYELFACIPAEWQKVISVSNKKCATAQGDITVLTDELWLLDIKEILGEDDNNFRRYAYYKGDNSPVRKTAEEISWFTRSCDQSDTPALISAAGTVSYGLTGYVVPCFTVGETKASPNLTASKNVVGVLVGSTEDLTADYEGTGALSFISSDPTIAAVVQNGKTCTVSGLKTGTAFVVISLSATDTHARSAVMVRIESGTVIKTASTLVLSNNNLTPTKDNTVSCTATVTGGTLSAVSRDETIATVSVSENKITVKGINEGSTVIDVKVTGDATHYDSEDTISVTVSDKPIILDPIPVINDWSSIVFEGGLVYNKEFQSVATKLAGYSVTYHSLSSDITARDHKDTGDYKVTISPKAGYKWQDGKTEGHDYSWNIDKDTAVISGKQDLILIKDETETVSITYTVTDTCSLIIDSNSNPGLVTATIDGNKVTFTSSCSTNGSAVIKLTTTPTINYNAAETVSVNVTVSMSSLVVLDGQNAASSLSVTRSSETYNDSTTYTVKNSNVSTWISNFNSACHKLTKVTDNNNATVTKTTASGEDNYKIKDAGTYKFWITPVTGYAWDNTGSIEEKSFSWTINRASLGMTTATQNGLSGSGTAMVYDGTAQTPVFNVGDKVDIKVTAQTNAGVYNTSSVQAKVTPKANYCWSDGSTGSKNVSWKIDPARLTEAQEPVFKADSLVYTLSNKTAQVQKPTADNFSFNDKFPKSSFTFTPPTTGRSAVGTYDSSSSSSYVAKFKINSSNYVFSDGSNTKIIPWSISPRKIKKPSMSADYSKPYTGSAHTGITITNNITTNDDLVTNGYVTVTMNKRLGKATIKKESERDEDGFSTSISTDHTVDFTPTAAGAYTVTYTLKKSTPSNVIWDVNGAEDTGDVSITFKITRAEITEKPSSPASLTVDYTLNSDNTKTYKNQTATIKSDKFTCTCKSQNKGGTYKDDNGILCTPTENYKWSKSIQAKQFDAYSVPWTILKADGFINVTYPTGKPKPSELTNDNYTTTFTVVGSNSSMSVTVDKWYIAEVEGSANTCTVNGFGEGSGVITLEAKENDWFKAKTVTIPVNLTVVHETMTSKTPWTFMRNFLQHLIWYSCEKYCMYSLYNSSTKKWGDVVDSHLRALTRNALDFAVNKLTNGSLKTMQAVVNKMKSFATALGTSATDTQVNASLKTNYNIDLTNTDRGSIFGYDIGVSTSQINNKAVVAETGSVGSYPSTTSVIEGITVTWPNGATDSNGTTRTTLTDKEKYAVKALNTWWLKVPLHMIDNYYGINATGPFCSSTALSVYIKPMETGTLATGGVENGSYGTGTMVPVTDAIFKDIYNVTDSATKAKYTHSVQFPLLRYGNMMMNLGVGEIANMNEDDDGTIGSSKDDRQAMDLVVAHELIHCILHNAMRFHGKYPKWFKESIAELLWGVDIRSTTIRRLARNATLLQKVFDANGNIDETGLTDDEKKSIPEYPYVFAYLLFRYLIKNYCK